MTGHFKCSISYFYSFIIDFEFGSTSVWLLGEFINNAKFLKTFCVFSSVDFYAIPVKRSFFITCVLAHYNSINL